MKLTVTELAQHLDAELVGDGSHSVDAIVGADTVCENKVAYVSDSKHIAEIEKSGASAVIVSEQLEGLSKPQLIVKNIDVAVMDALNVFAPKLKAVVEGVDPSATIGERVKLGAGVAIGPYAVIDDGVEIGEKSVIASGCKIGENTKVGKNCQIDSNVVIHHNCIIGNNVIIQSNSTIGAMGFGYSFIDGAHKLIPHNGGVLLEDFVEIGANCCVDRAKFGNTIIGVGTKIDNMVQFGHGVVIGKNCLIVSQVGIAGSCKLGDGVILAGQVGLADHVEIGDNAIVGAQGGVMGNIGPGEKVVGSPAIDSKEAFLLLSLMKRLPKTVKQLKKLTERIKKLEAAKDDKD